VISLKTRRLGVVESENRGPLVVGLMLELPRCKHWLGRGPKGEWEFNDVVAGLKRGPGGGGAGWEEVVRTITGQLPRR